MALIVKSNEAFQVASQPFSTLVPSGWLQHQEYEQFLDYLAQQFSDWQENINSALDFFDVNKCPEKFLKMIAFNLGMEIPLDEDLSPYSRALIGNTIRIYKTKGTFDQYNTAIRGIGLWIKMATGYDISIAHYPILNPYMFVDQFNYRCAKLRNDGGSDESMFVAIHPYEKELDGSRRIMYKHELPKYASEAVPSFHLFGVGDNYNRVLYMFDYLTGEAIEASDNVGIALQALSLPPDIYSGYLTFFYDNRVHLLFGQDSTYTPVAKVMSFEFPIYHDKTTAIQQGKWVPQDISFPAGVTEILANKPYQTFMFRNFVYFVGKINGSDYKVCHFNMLTHETEIIDIGKTLAVDTVTAFSRTKFYFILEESGTTYLYVYDLILAELGRLATLPSDVASLTRYSMASYNDFLILSMQDNRVLRYDIMYDTFTNLVFDITGYEDSAYLIAHGEKLCVKKVLNGGLDTHALYTVDMATIISATEDSTITMDSPPHTYIVDVSDFTNLFSAFVTAGRVVYPSTIIINIESYGEFTTSRSFYARKMQTIKGYLDRYVQAGVLAIINDDN